MLSDPNAPGFLRVAIKVGPIDTSALAGSVFDSVVPAPQTWYLPISSATFIVRRIPPATPLTGASGSHVEGILVCFLTAIATLVDVFRLEECRDLFASAPLDATYTFPMHEPDKARPRRIMPGQHLDTFPPTMPADWLPPLADEPEGNLLPPVYMFGWLYCRDTFRARFPDIKGNARLSFTKVVIKRFYAEHRGVTPYV